MGKYNATVIDDEYDFAEIYELFYESLGDIYFLFHAFGWEVVFHDGSIWIYRIELVDEIFQTLLAVDGNDDRLVIWFNIIGFTQCVFQECAPPDAFKIVVSNDIGGCPSVQIVDVVLKMFHFCISSHEILFQIAVEFVVFQTYFTKGLFDFLDYQRFILGIFQIIGLWNPFGNPWVVVGYRRVYDDR